MELKILMPYSVFPNGEASDSEKSSKDYGLKIGQAIQYEWLYKRGGSSRFYSQWAEFHRRRLYAAAKQPIGQYQSQIGTNGDTSFLNLNWTPPAIAPKFVNVIKNGMADREMTIKAFSQDVMSAEKRSKFQDEIETDMVAKSFLEQTQDTLNVDAFSVDPDKLPEDSEELSLYMQLNYKPGIEIAEEIAIDTVFQENKYDNLKDRNNKDTIEIGIAAAKHEFQYGKGVVLSYVDPANLVYSYTEDPMFSDCFYYGEVKQVHINELYKINDNLTQTDVANMAKSSGLWAQYNSDMQQYNLFQQDVCTLLYFNYKTTKEIVYKNKKLSNGGKRIVKKDSTFNPVENDMFEKVSKNVDIWYEGVMVAGTNEILKWEPCRNVVRPKSNITQANPNYVVCAPEMYKGSIQSTVERMIPFIDQATLTYIKLQQIKSKMIPDGVFIDIDGITEIDLGTGAAYNPEDALNLYFSTGSVFGKSLTADGDYNNAKSPIQELNTSASQAKMNALIQDYNFQISLIRDATGLNEARDGSMPDPKSLVGLQKLAALNSNTATRHILKASESITKRLAENISNRIADILKYSDMKEDYAMRIGKYNVEIIDQMHQLPLCDFGIYIELSPDDEEKQMLENNIQISLQSQDIVLEDAIDIRQVRNLKLANELLKVKRKRRLKEKQEREDTQLQMQAQVNQQAQANAAQVAMAKIQAETQGKIAIKEAEARYAMMVTDHDVQAKERLMDREFQYNMELKGMESQAATDKVLKQEKAKDERIDKQSTQQSKMIEQRKKDLPPIDFESTNDHTGDFNLEAFEPR